MLCKFTFLCLIAGCAAKNWNFLLIIVDDLRPALGCYGDQRANSPNIDRLAEIGTVFTRAYTQQALCGPSRNSFLTSRRPDTLRTYDLHTYWRRTAGNFTTLPQHLKEHGYITKSVGKVFHPGESSNWTDDSPYSWSEEPFHPYTNRFKDAAVCEKGFKNLVCPVNVKRMPNGTLPDMEIIHEAQRFLRSREENSAPFFLAVGFEKPHIPLKYPEEYLDLHPISRFSIPEPYDWPKNVSNIAYNPWNDIRRRDDVKSLGLNFPWEKIPEDFGASIIQSYYAAVSYIDDLIGNLLNQLEASGMRNNTIVMLTSDHGWSLGEHAEWAKYSNFEVAVRVPLVLSIPGTTSHRQSIDEVVELVDLYPTIAELAGVPIVTCENGTEQATCTEGLSFTPLLDLNQSKGMKWKRAAFSQYPRPSVRPKRKPSSDEPRLNEIKYMGYSLRTRNYRYTAWLKFSARTRTPRWKRIVAEELYDHRTDPNDNRNVAHSEQYESIKKTLLGLLRRGWRAALP